MCRNRFDPFNCRLARDIRNDLSKAFLRGLATGSRRVFQEKAEEYLDRDLTPVYENYVRERLEKYDRVVAEIIRHKPAAPFQQVPLFWEHGLYFELHELLEPAWKEATGQKQRGLQGLIRAAGMKIHAESQNLKAAAGMAVKALTDLEAGGEALTGIAGAREITAEVKKFLARSQDQTRSVFPLEENNQV